MISVRRQKRGHRAGQFGRIFRVGYYSRMDGLDCIWLVDENGKYCQTIDHDYLNGFYDVVSIAKERSFYGRGRPKLPPLK